MLLAETLSVSMPRSISFDIAFWFAANSPQILTGFVACVEIILIASKTTGDNASVLSVVWVLSTAKRYCVRSFVPME